MLTRERFASCTDRVELIRLRAVAARGSARTIDLEHQLVFSLKKDGQSGAVAARSLDCPRTAPGCVLEREAQQPPVATLVRGDGGLSLHDRRVCGEDRRAMRVAVRVDAEHVIGLVCQHEIRPPVLGGLSVGTRPGQ